ncbi:MAG: 23S rRNA (adenine(2503)-C(2))-methyltransferase RlmN [Verrucomicrobiota bacterium]|nr:23S rRNA (adenine(2503)-C(2))-methyltransferase RlmN [Verrucomicrobiota bacterium]
MDSSKIEKITKEFDLKSFRASQLRTAIFKNNISSFRDITVLSKDLRDKIFDKFDMLTVSEEKLSASVNNDAYKALLKLHDGHCIETVLLKTSSDFWTCCISSQVGCAFKCKFCATGNLGLTRNLTSEEISDQVLFWRFFIAENSLPVSLRNVVYMGMGEPFHNIDAVFSSVDELLNNATFNLGARHISISTAGLVSGIRKFADRFDQINLAVSLNSASDKLRTELMPVNKTNSLASLKNAVEYYLKKTKRKIFFEYILLRGENDSKSDAGHLIDYVRSFEFSHLIHVNLISYNPTEYNAYSMTRDEMWEFGKILKTKKIRVTMRKSLGKDILGSCGQLAGEA